jgi:hypothetical protein
MPKETTKKIVVIAAVYSAVAALLYVFVAFDLLAYLGNSGSILSMVTLLKAGLPFFLGAVALSAAASIFKTLFKGIFVLPVSRMLKGFAIAFLIYFFFVNPLMALRIQALGLYAFTIVIVASAYYAASSVLFECHQITLLTLLKFASIIVMGVIFRAAILSYIIEYAGIVADIVTFGFLFAAITALFYPLKYSDRSAIKKIGGWMGTNTSSKFIIGIIVAGYILFLRPYFYERSANMTLIGEWLSIGLMAIAGYLRMRSKLENISAPLILETWKKHQQELNFKSSDELETLSKKVEEFLKYGRKTDVLLFLFNFLFERMVHVDRINYALIDLINYQDPPPPRLIFSWEANFINKENLQKRGQVLTKTIKNLNENIFRINQLELNK